MQLVINIDEEKYKWLKEHIPKADKNSIVGAVVYGIPLPKGHGRLVDVDEIDNNIYDLTRSMDLNYGQISEVVDTAPTIIEADEE